MYCVDIWVVPVDRPFFESYCKTWLPVTVISNLGLVSLAVMIQENLHNTTALTLDITIYTAYMS